MEALAERYPALARPLYSPPKPVLFSELMSYADIAGMYFPFTVESNINTDGPFFTIPATMGHEMAHQCGFRREDEANFIAYAVCMESPRAYVRYSGTLLALIYAGNALSEADPAAYAAVWETYSPAVVADLRAYNAAWEPYDGEAAEVHEQLNDAYLKAFQEEAGVQSYGDVADYLIAWYQETAA